MSSVESKNAKESPEASSEAAPEQTQKSAAPEAVADTQENGEKVDATCDNGEEEEVEQPKNGAASSEDDQSANLPESEKNSAEPKNLTATLRPRKKVPVMPLKMQQ